MVLCFFVFLLLPQFGFWHIQDTSSLVEVPSMLALVVTQYLHHASRGPRQLLGDQKGKAHLLWLNIPSWWGKNNNYLNWCLWIYLPLIKKNNQTKKRNDSDKLSGSRQPKHAVFCAFPTPPQCPTVRAPCTAPPCLGGNEKRGRDKGTSKKNRDSESQQKMLHGTMLLRW